MTIALGLPHTPWLPARVEGFARLRRDLLIYERDERATENERLYVYDDANRGGPGGGRWRDVNWIRVFADREPNWSWPARLWAWGLETGADHLLQLQDDVEVAPDFWPALQAMLAAVPDQVIGLEAAHPAGKRLALEGHRWYTTADMLIGPGYVFPRAALADFLRWRRDSLRLGAVEDISEDMLIGVWCVSTGRKIWHPIPTLIDHDVTVASTYGNDQHKHRRPSVTWRDGDVLGFAAEDLERADWWRGRVSMTPPPHLGRFYAATPHLARRWVRDLPVEAFERAMADECPAEYRRWL